MSQGVAVGVDVVGAEIEDHALDHDAVAVLELENCAGR